MYCKAVVITILYFIAFPLQIDAQKSFDQYKKELRPLKGSKYLQKSLEGAEELARAKDYKNSMELLDMGLKKAKGMGRATEAVVTINKAHVIGRLFPKQEDKYIREMIAMIDEGLAGKPPKNLIEKSIQVMELVRYRVSATMDPIVENKIGKLNGMLSQKDQQIIADAKEAQIKQFEEKMDSEDAFYEIERLKAERERLESARQTLTESVEQNMALLNKRTAIINKMTDDQAKAEAQMQYNQRMIDSLKFMAQLDSISLLNSQHLIKEQESQLKLQQSELQLKESELHLKNSQQRLYAALGILAALISGFLIWIVYSTRKTNKQLATKNEEIENEKERSEELLLNILPKFIAQELKEKHKVKTRMIDSCTVIFTDFINFTNISRQLTPQELIEALDECFRAFDNIITDYNIEKIKTIGDSYMCAGGVPIPNKTHAVDAVNAAFEMVKFLDQWNTQREKEGKLRFDARIGIHSGPIIAGVVGVKKFAYDIWGNTVNVAARLEKKSEAQRINISASTYQLIKDHYQCERRGSISVKNMTDLEMYFVDHPIGEPVLN